MSLSHFQHPSEVVRHPNFEPEVKRAILASWASDAAAVEDQPALRKPDGLDAPVPVDDILDALRSIEEGGAQ